ncbi:MAG: hypothetical protein FJ009_16550 [Chloroflexi bacterium]|nr:hypothetical protein [Chloroflexota bacterium]
MINRQILFGVLFVVGALACGGLTWCAANRTAHRVEGLEAITRLAVLGNTPRGETVLIEGRVSERNPIKLDAHGFIAYLREGRAIVDSKGTSSPGNWSVRERVTPPLLIELSGGRALIANDDYALENGHVIENQPAAFARYSDTRYVGIAAGEPVIAVGVVIARGAQPEIKADFIARGTRESYAASQRSAGTMFLVISVIVAVAGGIFLLRAPLRAIYDKIKNPKPAIGGGG